MFRAPDEPRRAWIRLHASREGLYRWEITYPGSESERGEAGEGGLAGLLNLLDESGLGGGALDRGAVANGVNGVGIVSRASRAEG